MRLSLILEAVSALLYENEKSLDVLNEISMVFFKLFFHPHFKMSHCEMPPLEAGFCNSATPQLSD